MDTAFLASALVADIRGCIQKFPDWVDNEINNNDNNNNKHSLRSNTKGQNSRDWLTK
jgi:hypothetical protein